eukprot:6364959-Alexandrium_andersonii.AAC.1
MSASLVGSEMCIRDSACRADLVSSATIIFHDQRVHTEGAAPGPPVGGPVSYTHLTLPTICSV